MAYAPPLWSLANFQSDGVVYSPPGWFEANFWPGLPPIVVYSPTYTGTTASSSASLIVDEGGYILSPGVFVPTQKPLNSGFAVIVKQGAIVIDPADYVVTDGGITFVDIISTNLVTNGAPITITYTTLAGAGAATAAWSARVLIDGVDVSSRIVGDIRIDASEGAARIAELTIRPADGTGFAIADWSGQSITIDVVDMSTGVATDGRRLFTGLIDTPTLDLNLRTIGLLATDNLQNQIEALSAASIDTLVPGGYHSPVIFDPAARGWSRAQDRLATVPASLDLSPQNAFRLSDWAPRASANLTFTDDHILDGSLQTSQSSRHQLINRVDIDFAYRFPRVKAEGYEISDTYVTLGTIEAHAQAGNWWLTRAAVETAIGAAGGAIVSITYTDLPAFAVGSWQPGPSDYLLCMGYTALVSFEYTQTIEEQHAITVTAPNSIAAVGTLRDRLTGALEGEYPPVEAVEHSMLLYAKSLSSIPPKDRAVVSNGFTTSADVTLTPDTNRDAADAAMETLIAVAKTRIWASHRRNTVTASTALNPDVDLPRTIDINTSQLHARGKCRSVTHTLSPESGEAITTFSIAICSVAGTGITHPETPTAAPAGSSPATTALSEVPTSDFNYGPAEDHILTVTFPEVAAIERDKLDIPLNSSYFAPLTEDIFDITL